MTESLLNIAQHLRPMINDRLNGDSPRLARTVHRSLAILIVFGLLYGAVMGAFGGLGFTQFEQIIYSAVKVPILLLVTFLVGLPSFFVLNTLLGTRADFAEALRALIITQAALTIILASLAPYTAVWYLSFSDYQIAILFNGLMFAIASFTAQFVLRRLYRPLIARNPRHQLLMRIWLAMYIFIGIQAAWVLRPFVGDPTLPTQFFREDSWSNAYVFIARLIWNAISA